MPPLKPLQCSEWWHSLRSDRGGSRVYSTAYSGPTVEQQQASYFFKNAAQRVRMRRFLNKLTSTITSEAIANRNCF